MPSFSVAEFIVIRKEAEKSWRKIRGADKIELLLKGIPFKNGEPVQDDLPVQQKLAA